MTLRQRLCLTIALWCTAITIPAIAAEQDQFHQPILFQADQLVNDEKQNLISASGHVELAQGERLLLADTVTFNRQTGVVSAYGNVRLREPTGEILFANTLELTNDLRDGFIDQIRILLTDDSRLAANKAVRTGGVHTELDHAVYSPCALCKKDPTRPPLWQIKATRVEHNQETHDITYHNAWLEMFGVPVVYLPYFSHPDPTVDRRSGLLSPSFGTKSALGPFIRSSYYFDIAPETDATLEAGVSQKDGLLLGGEWRQRFEKGRLQMKGAAVRADLEEIENGQTIIHRNKFRGYVFGDGRFDLDDVWRWGFDLNRTTDNSFLRRYDYSSADILTSSIYTEGFLNQRNYASLRAYDYQDLRPGSQQQEPVVFPWAELSLLGDPNSLWGGRWSFNANSVGLEHSSGTNTLRFSADVGWRRDFISSMGLITTVDTDARADFYSLNRRQGATDPFTNVQPDNVNLRLFPQAQILTRYPVARTDNIGTEVFEPIVAYTISSRANNKDIPNEDSQDIEFDATNLFSENRFPGVDRLEDGQRLTYGARASFYSHESVWNTSLFLGQTYRFDKNTDLPADSGLGEKASDIVGRLHLDATQYLNLDYDFRLDSTNFTPHRHDVFLTGNIDPVQFGISYLFVDQVTGVNNAQREELAFGANWRLTPVWSIGATQRRDLTEGNRPLLTTANLTYRDECFTFETNFSHDSTVREDVNRGTSIYFRITFKNIGEVKTPTVSTDFLYNNSSNDKLTH